MTPESSKKVGRGTRGSYSVPPAETLEDLYALRINMDVYGNEVEQELRQLQYEKALEIISQNPDFILVKFADSDAREHILPRMEQWLRDGKLSFVTPVLRDPESGHHQILTDEITVRFHSQLSEDESRAIAEEYNLDFAQQNEFVPNQYIVRVAKPFGLQTYEVAQALADADSVDFATPNYISEHTR